MIFLIPLIVFALGQILKLIIAKLQHPTRPFRQAFDYGGMPSTHTAIVASLAIVVATKEGANSTEFGIAIILAIIVIYDAARLRTIVGQQSVALNALRPANSAIPALPETVGHSLAQIIIGIIFGIACSLILLPLF